MPENQIIEWKEHWKDEYLKWICGFANAIGGTLIIGKNDKGKIVGVDNSTKLLEDIPNKVRDILGIIVEVNLRNEEGKEYIEIYVENYPFPVSYKGQYFYRSGSTKQELKGSALDNFLLKKIGKRWDGVPVPNIQITDFSQKAFEKFKTMASKSGRLNKNTTINSYEVIIDNLHLKEGEYYKRAAVLLFHDEPEKFFSGSFIKLGFFKSETELLYQDIITGNLFDQADKTIEILLTKYLRESIFYEGIQRIERFPYPEPALREALLNAIVHKDYSSGIPIQIKVYENRIVFWNIGKLPENWTIESLQKEHPSNPFNPDIANAFFRAGLIESWGRGIQKITYECFNAGLSVPKFKYEFSGIWLEMISKENFTSGIKKKTSGINKEKSSGIKKKTSGIMKETSGENKEKTSGINKEKTSEKIILSIFQNPRITIPELAKILNISTRAVEMSLAKLKNNKVIERIGSTKKGYWKLLK